MKFSDIEIPTQSHLIEIDKKYHGLKFKINAVDAISEKYSSSANSLKEAVSKALYFMEEFKTNVSLEELLKQLIKLVISSKGIFIIQSVDFKDVYFKIEFSK